MAIIKEYIIKCTQADGSEYTYKMRGFTRMEAAAFMREDKKVFMPAIWQSICPSINPHITTFKPCCNVL